MTKIDLNNLGVPDKIIARIQKLNNLKEGAEAVGSLAEAENAAAKMQALLMEYNLTLQDVTKQQVEAKANIVDDWINLSDKQDKRESFWVPKLYGAIARNNLCYVSVSQHGIRIIGHDHNIRLVLYIAEQMVAKVRIAEKQAWKMHEADTTKPEWAKEKRGTFRRGFFDGAAHGINQRLRREKEEMGKDTNPYAIVIVKAEKEVDDWIKEYNDRVRKQNAEWKANLSEEDKARMEKEAKKRMKAMEKRKGPKGLSSNQGWRSGYDAGLKMDINKGMENQKPKGNIE